MPLRFKRFERIRSHLAFRFTRFGVAALAVTLAVAIVSTLTIDLGPGLRALAEREGSKRVGRAMRIGRLGVRLFTGKFVLEDFSIAGLSAEDRPFITAKRIDISLAWDAMMHREVLLDSIEMTDWHMVIEQWAGGRHSFPKFNMGGGGGPKRFVTTMQYVRTRNGTVTFEDHGAPWGAVARNLDVTVTKFAGYRGEATFHGGTVWVQNYVPMDMSMKAVFSVDGGKVHFERMLLISDGAESMITGDADIPNWPEMKYQVKSTVDFKRMRELFFAKENYTLSGEGRFDGVFHLFKGGRALTGSFESEVAGLQIGELDYEFPNLKGKLGWFPNRFEVTDTTTDFYGGVADLEYSILSSGKPGQPSKARFDAAWEDVDLAAFSDFLKMSGLRLAGRWNGRNLLEWPLGHFRERSGDGRFEVVPPAGVDVLAGTRASDFASGPDAGGFHPGLGHLPIAGHVTYQYDGVGVAFSDGRFSTPATDVTFSGRTAWGDNSNIPFHVTSADLQESDRVLAGMMTAFGAPTNPITVGGSAEFSGVMTEAIGRPRVEGHFVAQDMRAFDVTWGRGEAGLVIQNSYVDVTAGQMQKDGGEIVVNGRFSLGFPRRDKGEEINGRIHVGNWTAVDFKHAFDIDDYDVAGIVSGEYHLYGPYHGPYGFGSLTIDNGIAYGEPFETASGSLRFEGNGVRIDGIEMRKSGGTAEGAAFVGWNGTYSFNATGRRIPMDSVKATAYPQAKLTGLLEFNADGTGTFDVPRYQFRGRIRDLFVADEGVGEVTGRLDIRGDAMTVELEAASPRLAVSGTGRIDLTEAQDADITLRFTDTSLDPYARALEPRISPFTTAVGSGTLRIVGQLANRDKLVVDMMFDQLQVRAFDYPLRNAKPIHVLMSNNVARIDDMRFIGDGTELDVTGTMDMNARRVAGLARGRANLGLLQGFYRNIRSSGNAELTAQVSGSLDAPVILGRATIENGRLRYFSLPHSLEQVNGTILFDSRNIRLDGLTARVADGQVNFDGRIGLEGYAPADLALTASGRSMRLRYPEGVRSEIDADLSLTGRVTAPVLAGSVMVQSALWTTRFDTGGSLFDFGGGSGGGTPIVAGAASTSNIPPVRLDVRVIAPGTLRIQNSNATIVSSADLQFRGTYDRPIVFGRAEISRGEFIFEGRRYLVTRGTLDFTNPLRMEPMFDIAAETQVRVPGQTYRVTLSASGTMQRLRPVFMSDPPLPPIEVASLLLGTATGQDADLRALQTPDRTEQQLVQARVARMLVNPISGQIGEVVESTFGVDTFQLTPILSDTTQQSARFNPSARLTIGKRISNRAYLTFSRSLSSTSDQIVLLEYDQTDRLSWILTRNEDESYSLDIRVRKEF
ncbi:MAG TPA: translocation/assembly module TamB domain-containing protein [Vicinamibacterales bacterium]|nr:translocation/assembly module TamB domain-containing protein [Vicinamibacterales bacterium]